MQDALDRGRLLHLSYHVPARDETTERDVDPMRLLLVEGRSYLEAWCRRAEGVRLFRLDRVERAEVLDAPAAPPPSAEQRDLAQGLFQPSPDDALVTLALRPGARWVADYYPCESVEEADGRRPRGRPAHREHRLGPGPRPAARRLRAGAGAGRASPGRCATDARAALAAYGG